MPNVATAGLPKVASHVRVRRLAVGDSKHTRQWLATPLEQSGMRELQQTRCSLQPQVTGRAGSAADAALGGGGIALGGTPLLPKGWLG